MSAAVVWPIGAFLALLFASVFTLAMLALSRPTAGPMADRLAERLGVRAGATSPVMPGGGGRIVESARRSASWVAGRGHLKQKTARRLDEAAVSLAVPDWLLVRAGIAAGVALTFALLGGFRMAPVVAGAVVGWLTPDAALRFRARRRRTQFAEDIPDALQMIAGSLASSHSVPQALELVAGESEGPMRDELLRALAEMRLGRAREDALSDVAERMASAEFSWVVMAVRINREMGGNLGEILRTTSATLRERARVRRQAAVLSAEGRLSAWIIGLLPAGLVLYLLLVRADYVELLVTTPLGLALTAAGALLMVTGVAWMSQLVRVEV
ncbi:MAG: type II secretion system F family protein [Candidatus Nanopelagicales bacterium]|nr:type II secretion system F family protein [Candidatus Nanopelagicales bacterium]